MQRGIVTENDNTCSRAVVTRTNTLHTKDAATDMSKEPFSALKWASIAPILLTRRASSEMVIYYACPCFILQSPAC